MAIPAWLATILGKTIASSVGKTIEKVVDYIPGRSESLRRERRKLIEQLEKLQNTEPFDAVSYTKLSSRLSEIDKIISEKG